MGRVCLDLFCGLKGFSQAFEDGWEVYTVDIEERFDPTLCADIMDVRPGDLLDMVGVDRDEIETLVILASPPCTEFSTAQNLNGGHDPNPEAILLVYHAMGLIKSLSPDYWFLENPRGRLRSFIGQPTATVTYCQYGEDHMKPTDLWGDHPPMTYKRCAYGEDCHVNHRDGSNVMRDGVGKRTKAEKSKVPEALSVAIRDAVDEAVENPPPTQSTLGVSARGE